MGFVKPRRLGGLMGVCQGNDTVLIRVLHPLTDRGCLALLSPAMSTSYLFVDQSVQRTNHSLR